MEDNSTSSINKEVQTETPFEETSTEVKRPLSSKNAIEFLLTGTLQSKVCRYCLDVTSQLLDLDTVLQIGGQKSLYQVTISDMIASFYPFKVTKDPNLPNKICERCLNCTLRAYLFTQQCEQSDRALRNYLEDITEKVDKLDPIERKVKRGRQKLNPNPDKIYVAHKNVIDYAEPIIHLVNQGATLVNSNDGTVNDLSCSKCWQILPNIESLLNHEKIHPKSMWYHCHQCGRAFAKLIHLKKHIKSIHSNKKNKVTPTPRAFECKTCGDTSANYKNYLQHIEKHKFKKVLKQVLLEKTEELCTVCLDKAPKMVDLETRMSLSGSCPELNGDKSMYHIVGSTLPDMNYFYSYTGTKICQDCSDRAISTYLFINQTLHTRRRLNTCITTMLETIEQHINLTKTEEEEHGNMFIELSESLIVPIIELELTTDDLFDDAFDETQLKVEVLEDKYRIPPSSESESEDVKPVDDFQRLKDEKMEIAFDRYLDTIIDVDTASKKGNTANCNEQLQNGFGTDHDNNSFDDVSEFLTFKNKQEPIKVSKKTSYRCDLCSKSFKTVYFLKKHLLKHIYRKTECKFCDVVFKSKFHLNEHRKMAHLLYEPNYRTCKTCGRTFTDSAKMLKHQKRHFKLECSLCDKLFRSQDYYDVHVQRHLIRFTISNKKARQTCSFCESECLSKNKLSVHVNKVHLQIKPYSCDMCERKFYTKYNLANHRKLHSVRSNEKCEFCGVILKCRRDLVIHVRKHMGLKPHSCMMCTEAFYSQRDKNTHMTKMHGGRMICNICRIVFKHKSELKSHIRTLHVSQF